jgi:hypothetical protein
MLYLYQTPRICQTIFTIFSQNDDFFFVFFSWNHFFFQKSGFVLENDSMKNKIIMSFPTKIPVKVFGLEGALERCEYYLDYCNDALKQDDLSYNEIVFILDLMDRYEYIILTLTTLQK